jgi:hypothetical protein
MRLSPLAALRRDREQWTLKKLTCKQKVAFAGAISIRRWQTIFAFAIVYICTLS